MANEISYILIDTIRSKANGDLETENNRARYSTRDTNNPRMSVDGVIVLDPIDPEDTVLEWWGKVRAQILAKDEADNAEFLANMGGQ